MTSIGAVAVAIEDVVERGAGVDVPMVIVVDTTVLSRGTGSLLHPDTTSAAIHTVTTPRFMTKRRSKPGRSSGDMPAFPAQQPHPQFLVTPGLYVSGKAGLTGIICHRRFVWSVV